MDDRSPSVKDFEVDSRQMAGAAAEDVHHPSSVASKSQQPHEAVEDSAFLSDSAHGNYSSADDEAVFDRPTSRHSSPETSQDSSDEEISVLESVSERSSSRHHSDAPLTPSKTHLPFHHPSSVRAMQLDTTPPHLATLSSQRKRFHTPSRQTSTPHSIRSGHRSTPTRLMNSSPVRTVKKEHPLVLLHITLLPPTHNYSLELLEAILPPPTFANWKLLHERVTPTVLHRGILIPHPREDYDILEERVLESLGLKESRILKCGHFHLSPEEEADDEPSEDEEDEDLADVDRCEDCGRRVRDGKYGDAGTGSKRWDVKVFAANGLMRAGAWSAAWREMERIDIELIPWMEESMKRELALRSEEERSKREHDAARKEEGIAGLDDERLREIYGQDASARATPAKERTQDDVDGLNYDTPFSHHAGTEFPRSPSQSPFKFESSHRHRNEVSLWDLLRNYLYLTAQDPRNIAIWILSIIILYLTLRISGSSPHPSPELSVSSSIETSSLATFATPSTTLPDDEPEPTELSATGISSILRFPEPLQFDDM